MEKVKGKWLANGFAMFSMFFGAGNIIFPLIVGLSVQGSVSFALLGLLLTAVIMPFSGLLAITLFDGNYISFFSRMGKIPGLFILMVVLALIGPFGGIPRCVSLTYSSIQFYFSGLNLVWFVLAASLLIFFCSVKKQKIIDLLGYVLTPLLLISLTVIVVKGIFFTPHDVAGALDSGSKAPAFLYGLKAGYNTMDLLAAFFFSSIICAKVKEELKEESLEGNSKSFFVTFGRAAALGGLLLGVIYVGFALVASFYGPHLQNIPPDQLLGAIGHMVLGPYAGVIVCLAIALSCLTTAIALTAVSAEFVQKTLLKEKISYEWAVGLVLIISALVSMLEFSGILRLLAPVLQVCYPALIGLSVLNVLHKLFGINVVKTPVYIIIAWMLTNLVLLK